MSTDDTGRSPSGAARGDPVAIVGVGCRFPGGVVDLSSCWRLLEGGLCATDPDGPVTSSRGPGMLDDVAGFDADFFGISPREALHADPAQRLLLEVAWEALEHAAIAPDSLAGSATGVFVGLGLSDYGRRHFLGPDPSRMTPYSGTGTFLSVAAGRIAYTLGTTGPAMTVDTACSSSLVGVHLAVRSLRSGESDLALAGGANLVLSPEPTAYFAKLQALAADGRCKAFDADADGYGRAEGVGVVVLQRLSDALAAGRRVLGVIRGTAVNHDGRSNGLTAPSGRAQQEVMRLALADAGCEPGEVGYVEAHGTGTPLGDPIEAAALAAVYGEGERPLAVGSVKTNLGHTETAAGVAGLLKALLVLRQRRIPPHLHLRRLNPRISFEGTRLRIPTSLEDLGEARIAGVSSFGLSGTNAHIVLEGPPEAPAQPSSGDLHPLVLSARSEPALRQLAEELAAAVEGAHLGDVAHTLAVGRASLPHRAVVVAADSAEARAGLGAVAAGEEPPGVVVGRARRAPQIAFLCGGQGSQRPGMGLDLYAEDPVFRDALDRCAAALRPHLDRELLDILGSDDVHHTGYAQPCLFAVQVALASWWRSRGVVPDVLLGHSVGEIVAACIAGVFTIEDAATLVAARGRLMGDLPTGGAMLAVFLEEERVRRALDDAGVGPEAVSVAAVNHPTEVVLSGDEGAIDLLERRLLGDGVRTRRLRVSHAFHSHRTEPMLDAFEAVVAGIPRHPPQIPVISNLDGLEAGERLTDPTYWRALARHAVRFADGLSTARALGCGAFVELGPAPVLTSVAGRSEAGQGCVLAPSLHPDRPARRQLLESAGALWARGVPVLWEVPRARVVDLPRPPWQRQRFWLDEPPPAAEPYADWVLERIWEDAPPETSTAGRWQVRGHPELAAALGSRGLLVEDGPTDLVVAVTGDVEQAVAHVLAAAQTGLRLHLVGEGPDPLAWGAAVGLGRALFAEHPDRWGGSVEWRGTGSDDHRSSDAVSFGAKVPRPARSQEIVGDRDLDAVVDALLEGGAEEARLDGARRTVARLRRSRRALSEPPAPLPSGTWVVTGAFGALGQRVARWLVERGVGRLVLASRRGADAPGARALIAELTARGAQVEAVAADLADPAQASALVDRDDLRGVLHLAGTRDDAPVDALTPDRLLAVLRSKLISAWNLHLATRDRPLERFVLVSSAAGWLGVAGQAAYAAANAGLDALARMRREQGLPALSLAFGPWTEGMAADVAPEIRAGWARQGIEALQPADGLAILGRLLGSPVPDVLVAPFDWHRLARPHDPLLSLLGAPAAATGSTPAPDVGPAHELAGLAPEVRRLRLAEGVHDAVAAVLGLGDRRIDSRQGFFDAGMDSLMAVQLRERLSRALDVALSPTVAFDHPTVEALVAHLDGLIAPAPRDALPIATSRAEEPVAIVGIACRLPGGADDPERLWALLVEGRDAVTEVPADRFDVERVYDPAPGTPGRLYTRRGGFVDGIEGFEPAFFGISPREAAALDPQQRLLLEVSWEALEDAAIAPDGLGGTATGVFVGIGASEYGRRFDPLDPASGHDAYAGTGNASSFAAGRIAYVLGLRGPAVSVDTACSSSLVAVHAAVEALRAGQVGLALAGGAHAIVGPETTVQLSQLRALSPDGRCKTFDAGADGYVRGEGCGVVVLKRLSDAQRDGDRVLAVIRGVAVNHDGASSGLTVPNGVAQQEVIGRAVADARVDPADVDFIECHGTGTRLGDPIEVGALAATYGKRPDDRPLILRSVKTNLGHLEAAAGVAGLLGAVLALRHGRIPPHLHLTALNPALPLTPSMIVPTTPVDWPRSDRPRLAAVSSFGISGTNAHVVLEEAPSDDPPSERPTQPAGPTLLLLSARTEPALSEAATRLAAHLRAHPELDLADVAYTLDTGRAQLGVRAARVVSDRDAAIAALDAVSDGTSAADRPKLAWLCTGAGPQAVGMGRQLYDGEPVFRDAFDTCAAIADRHLSVPLREVLFGRWEGDAPIDTLAYTQPAMFAYEWAMAALWRSLGVTPDAVIGHSTGQIVAATLAGALSLEDGVSLICARAALMDSLPPDGAMAAVLARPDRVEAALRGEPSVSIAAINGPEEAVISGRSDRIDALCARFAAEGLDVRRLRISQAAHSPLIEPVLDRYERLLEGVTLRAPRIPLVENVTGSVAGDEICTAGYWRRHMREPVRFADGMRTLADLGFRHFLELGNHPVLSGAGARTLPNARFYASGRRGVDEVTQLLDAAGRLWCDGIGLDPRRLHDTRPGRKVALPTTPFQRQRHWVDAPKTERARRAGQRWTYGVRWQRVDRGRAVADGPVLVIGGGGGLGDALRDRLDRPSIAIAPDRLHELDRLLDRHAPTDIVSLTSLDAPEIGASAVEAGWGALAAPLDLIQRLAGRRGVRLWLVTRGACQVGDEAVRPEQATVWGLGRALTVEQPALRCVRVDLEDDDVSGLLGLLQTGTDEDELAIRGGEVWAPRLGRVTSPDAAPPVRGTWWITGGLGALGLRVAEWLAELGADAIVLTSRAPPSQQVTRRLEQLADRISVRVELGDVADRGVVDAIRSRMADLPPLRGVVHAAGVVDDASVQNLDEARVRRTWRGKVDGAFHLHRVTAGDDLDAFVLFSSAAALVGSAGQSAYAAGNAMLDALARARRTEGLPAISLCWGPWAEAGLATQAARRWTDGGVHPIAPAVGVDVMGRLLAADEPVVGVVDLDWPTFGERVLRRPVPYLSELVTVTPPRPSGPDLRALAAGRRADALREWVTGQVAAVTGADPADVDVQQGFFDAGMDSLMAVEVADRLEDALRLGLPATVCFDHPSVDALSDHLLQRLFSEPKPAEVPVATPPSDEPVAIVGLSCRMPGADDPDAFWALLRDGIDPMSEVPPDRWDIDALYDPRPGTPGRMYAREAGFVDGVDQFDPEFFGISPREAASMDPQQRMLLEVGYEALEHAGIAPSSLKHSQTGVFVGVGDSGYLRRFERPGGERYPDTYAGTGNLEAFVSGRVAYALGLRGPNLALNTACSSSLVAIHLACQALRSGDCDAALAGGVHLMLSPDNALYVSQLGVLSPDGRCKTFDAAADGYGRAEGCAIVVLKRLSDAQRDGDPVLAVIRGTHVNHDGASSGLTVPSGPAQQEVIRRAVQRAGVHPHDVSYLEAHGTGTVLGDPIEVHAIEAELCRERPADRPLHLGAVKSAIGHLEVAAGAASVAKMVLALQHREIPPHLHYSAPNPDIDLERARLVIDTAPAPWTPYDADTPLICGVSGFGLAGTNAHVVLAEAPDPPPVAIVEAPPDRPSHVLGLSARSAPAMAALAGRYAALLEGGADLADVAFSVHTTRDRFEHRAAVVAETAGEAASRLRQVAAGDAGPLAAIGVAGARRPKVAWLFSGQGSQYPGMGRELYEAHPVYRDAVDRCAAVLDPLLGRSLRDLLHDPDDDAIHDTRLTQPGLFTVEYALAELWRSFGVEPDVVMGHSVGELVAATVAGVLDLPDALRLVAARGRLMGELPAGGAMIAVFAPVDALEDALACGVEVAAVNGPEETVLSGPSGAVEAARARLIEAGIDVRPLTVSHAFHSALMEPALDAFEAEARAVGLRPPAIPMVGNLSGRIVGDEIADPVYWRRHLREPVRFADGVRALIGEGVGIVLEVGPHTSLLGMAGRIEPSLGTAASLRRGEPAWQTLLAGLGALFVRGVEIDWRAFDRPWPRRRVALPNYPWQRRRCWMAGEELPGRAPGRDWVRRLRWPALPARGEADPSGRWLILGNRGGLGGALARILEARGATAQVLELDHAAPTEESLRNGPLAGGPLRGVVHLYSLDAAAETEDTLLHATERGPLSALYLVRALLEADQSPSVAFVTRGAVAVRDGEGCDPGQATLWGLGRVVRAEHPELRSVLLDLPTDEPVEADALLALLLATDGEPEAAVRDGARRVPRLASFVPESTVPTVSPEGTVLITGGLGALGLQVARLLVDRGARHLALVGRSAPSDEAVQAVQALRERGATVRVLQADVAERAEVERVLASIDEAGPPLMGVVHAAGVVADATLRTLDRPRFLVPFGAKVAGAWNLHQATIRRPLDLFVLFGAGAALIGAPGQASYAAANAFLDGLAHHRQALGLPALSVDWGAWAEVGMAARMGEAHQRRQASEGVRPMPPRAALSVLGRLLGHQGQVAVMDVDWERLAEGTGPGSHLLRPIVAVDLPEAVAPPTPPEDPTPDLRAQLRALADHERQAHAEAVVRRLVTRILALPPDREVDPHQPLLELGLDSLLAVELKNALMDEGVDVPVARVMTGPSVAVVARLAVVAAEPDEDAPEPDAPAALVAVPQEAPIHPVVSHFIAAVATAVFIVGGYLLGQALSPDGSDGAPPEAAEQAEAPEIRTGRRGD